MRFLLPFYHAVSDRDLPHLCHLYKPKKTEGFKRDLDFLGSRYKFVDLATFNDAAQKKFRDVKVPLCHLTFDDGLAECYSVIAPILKQRGIPATFFINSAFIDNRDMMFRLKASLLIDKYINQPLSKQSQQELVSHLDFGKKTNIAKSLLQIGYSKMTVLDKMALIMSVDFSDYLQTHRPYLSWTQLNTLHLQGFTIGAHSHDHPEFRFLPIDKQLEQVKVCLYEIQAHLGITAQAFSFPFTDHGVSLKFFNLLHQTSSISITFGTAGMKEDIAPANFQRVAMETGLGPLLTISKAMSRSTIRQLLGCNIINRS